MSKNVYIYIYIYNHNNSSNDDDNDNNNNINTKKEVALEFNPNILSCRLYWFKLQQCNIPGQGPMHIYSTGTPKWSLLFGIHRQHPKEENLFMANQSYLP